MARWRERPALVIPPWVADPAFEDEAMAWLDDLYERDPELFYEAFVEIISTPTYPAPRDG